MTVLGATACGDSSSETEQSTTAPNPTAATSVYFVRDEVAIPVGRALDATSEDFVRDTLRLWVQGPTPSEVAAGISTAVPPGVEVLAVRTSGDALVGQTVTVDLSEAFASGGGTFAMRMRLAQLVMTVVAATSRVNGLDPGALEPGELSDVGVELWLEGQPVTVFSSEGIILNEPLTVDGVRDLLP